MKALAVRRMLGQAGAWYVDSHTYSTLYLQMDVACERKAGADGVGGDRGMDDDAGPGDGGELQRGYQYLPHLCT